MYPELNEIAKKHIMKYDDPLKVFLEITLNQIEYFKVLSKYIKNEWIFHLGQK